MSEGKESIGSTFESPSGSKADGSEAPGSPGEAASPRPEAERDSIGRGRAGLGRALAGFLVKDHQPGNAQDEDENGDRDRGERRGYPSVS